MAMYDERKKRDPPEGWLRLLTMEGRVFEAGSHEYELRQQSLGGELLLGRCMEKLGINRGLLATHTLVELLRIADARRKEALDLIACAVCGSRMEHLRELRTGEIALRLDRTLDTEEIATLLSAILLDREEENFREWTGLYVDMDIQRRLSRERQREGGSVNLGGRSVFGRLIDTACHRYGWTMEYTVWGLPGSTLRLMLADQVVSMSVSDDECRKLGIRTSGEIDGDNASLDDLRALTTD